MASLVFAVQHIANVRPDMSSELVISSVVDAL